LVEEALLRHQQIMNIKKPTKRHVAALADWMDRPDRGNVVLIGKDRDIWREPDMDDLVLMSSDDFLTSRVMPSIIYYYHQILGRHIHVSNPLLESNPTNSQCRRRRKQTLKTYETQSYTTTTECLQ
jgi:type IV secretory pathway ATPase VirB11/archaellum biosynthesis ATPase